MSASSVDLAIGQGRSGRWASVDPSRRTRPGASGLAGSHRLFVALLVGTSLSLAANDTPAAVLGELMNSVGVFAALTALLTIDSWPVYAPDLVMPAAGTLLVTVGSIFWLWRMGLFGRWLVLAKQPFTRDQPPRVAELAATPSRLPPGLVHETLLAELRLHFMRVQTAWDAREIQVLQALTTPQMLDELCLALPHGEAAATQSHTEIVTLQAGLFAVDEVAGTWLVSVEFHGLMRECPDQAATPFREFWMVARSSEAKAGWKLARHQVLF